MQITKWELSQIPENEIQGLKKLLPAGDRIVKIVQAAYYDEYTAERESERDTYTLTVEDVETGSQTTLRYWLKTKDRTKYNESVLGTMRSLGKAVFGPDFIYDVPAPGDIIGAVVCAEVKVTKDNSGKEYNRVYHYTSVTNDNMVYSDIEQYYYEG